MLHAASMAGNTDAVAALGNAVVNPGIRKPAALYGAGRVNARGWDITDPVEVDD